MDGTLTLPGRLRLGLGAYLGEQVNGCGGKLLTFKAPPRGAIARAHHRDELLREATGTEPLRHQALVPVSSHACARTASRTIVSRGQPRLEARSERSLCGGFQV
jgi:hypothetical protein